jgi:hypothetical protein
VVDSVGAVSETPGLRGKMSYFNQFGVLELVQVLDGSDVIGRYLTLTDIVGRYLTLTNFGGRYRMLSDVIGHYSHINNSYI